MTNTDPNDPFAAQRAHTRVEVAMPAFLQANGARLSVQILDLSAGGAKLDCQVTSPVGSTVVLDCGSFRRTAVVRWQDASAMGLSFDRELDEREVFAMAERSRALVAWMRPRN